MADHGCKVASETVAHIRDPVHFRERPGLPCPGRMRQNMIVIGSDQSVMWSRLMGALSFGVPHHPSPPQHWRGVLSVLTRKQERVGEHHMPF